LGFHEQPKRAALAHCSNWKSIKKAKKSEKLTFFIINERERKSRQ
jgi:hypothetical protein